MKVKKVLIFTGLTLFIACSSQGDRTEELSKNYFYRDEGRNVKDILSHRIDRRSIYSKILSYTYNSQFILVLQEPLYDKHREMIAFDLRSDFKKYPNNSNEDRITSERVADSILKNDGYYLKLFSKKNNFWIIITQNDSLIGPLTKEEYLHKREELGVPKELQLKEFDGLH